MLIRRFLPKGVAFAPQVERAMGEAFESAWRVIQHAGLSTGKEALAAKIITAAAKGEQDAETLRDLALSELGVHR